MRRIADRLLRLSPLVNCVFECCSTKAQKGATHPQSASHILSQVGTAFVMSAHKSGLKFWPAIAGDGKKNSAGLLRVLSRRRFPPQAARGVPGAPIVPGTPLAWCERPSEMSIANVPASPPLRLYAFPSRAPPRHFHFRLCRRIERLDRDCCCDGQTPTQRGYSRAFSPTRARGRPQHVPGDLFFPFTTHCWCFPLTFPRSPTQQNTGGPGFNRLCLLLLHQYLPGCCLTPLPRSIDRASVEQQLKRNKRASQQQRAQQRPSHKTNIHDRPCRPPASSPPSPPRPRRRPRTPAPARAS